MNHEWYEKPFVFPKWANYALPMALVAIIGGMFYLPTLVALGASPMATAVGYSPKQPVPYSHALHVGKLGLDCRYCHTTVEKTGFAALPATQTCMNCHSTILTASAALQPLHKSWETGMPMQWVKIHNLPQYAYFNHSAHVTHGVGCIECHGRIDQMDQVMQVKPLSMGWCLDCHRDPGSHLRPADQVTSMTWAPDPDKDPKELAHELLQHYKIHDVQYMQSCSTCHR